MEDKVSLSLFFLLIFVFFFLQLDPKEHAQKTVMICFSNLPLKTVLMAGKEDSESTEVPLSETPSTSVEGRIFRVNLRVGALRSPSVLKREISSRLINATFILHDQSRWLR